MEVIKPLLDSEDIKRILKMNEDIVKVNCEILRAVGSPLVIEDRKPGEVIKVNL